MRKCMSVSPIDLLCVLCMVLKSHCTAVVIGQTSLYLPDQWRAFSVSNCLQNKDNQFMAIHLSGSTKRTHQCGSLYTKYKKKLRRARGNSACC
uniref:Secreted protein n=1 Tax=Poecilia reticulata TaxID=8081 RepID=A0A3P9N4P6_POERE